MFKISFSLLLLSSAFISLPVLGSNEVGIADSDKKSVRSANYFEDLSDGLVLAILGRLDLKSAAASESTCSRFRRVLNDEVTQGIFLSPEDVTSLEEIVGKKRMQTVFVGGGYHKLAMLLNRIRAQPADILTDKFKNYLLGYGFSDQQKLIIFANSKVLFTPWMRGYQLTQVSAACAKLKPEQIAAKAQTIAGLLTARMSINERANIIEACANVGPEQIAAISANSAGLFTTDIGVFGQARIIVDLGLLKPEQITALHFVEGQSVQGRLDYIYSIANATNHAFPG